MCTRILVMREGELVAELDGRDGDRARGPAPRDARDAADGRRPATPSADDGATEATDDAHRRDRPRHAGPAAASRCRAASRLQEYALVGVIIALVVVGAILKPDTFPTIDNFRAILTQSSVVGVLAIGMTFVIATAGIDLSVGSIVAAAGVAGGLVVDDGAARSSSARSGSALLLGTVNATAIAYGKVVPFVATLAMLAIARGLALQMSDKKPISLLGSDGRALVRHRRDPRPAGLDRDLRRA